MTDAVSDFGAKLLSGEETSPEAWQRHLREVHGRLPGATSAFASRHATAEGRTSYELLADSAVSAARELDRPVDVLDLACFSHAERIERFHRQRHRNDHRGICGSASAMASTRDSPGATG